MLINKMQTSKHNTIKLCAMLFITALIITSCSGNVHDRIIGKWQSLSNGSTIEFFRDNTYVSTLGFGSSNGKYLITDDGRIRIDSSAFGFDMSNIYEVEFDGDTMKLTGSGGGDTLQRIDK
jgi:hypothetical protein